MGENMKKLKAVLFDLDGTLTDTLQDLTNAVNYALAENKMPLRTLAEVRKMVGNGVKNLVLRALPEGTKEEDFARVFACFTEYYKDHSLDATKPYAGVLELLHFLEENGVALAVLSNKAHAPTVDIVNRFFPRVFSVVFGQREGVPKKPHPAAVHEILKMLGASADEAAYVGDSEVDVLTAKNANLALFAVTWGFRDPEELINAGATKLFHTAEDLSKEILSRI